MANQTPIYGFPVYDPIGMDSTELGLTYFNDLTGNSSTSLTNKLETILSELDSSKSTIYAKQDTQWASDTSTILKSGEWGVNTTRGILRLGNGIDAWNDLEDYLPALPVLSGSSEPTSATIGSLGQFYIHNDALPRLFICVKSSSPYLWVSLSYYSEMENFRDTYDSDGDGIVDDSGKLGGQLPSHYLNTTQRGVAGGVATLDSNSKVPASQLDLTAINTDIFNVKTTADEAKSVANSAATDAGQAKDSADIAKSTADTAKSIADAAKTTADTAKSIAEGAAATAGQADTKADNAVQTANTANTTAGEAKITAESANATAEAAQTAAANKITGGYEISIPTTAWTQSGNTWVATIADAKIPAETATYRYSPHIHWNAATMAALTGIGAWAIVETPAAGGSYVVVIGSAPDELPDKPEVALVGEMTVQEVTRK